MAIDGLIWQPPGSSICGQCVVAMLTGSTMRAVLSLLGDKRTYPRDLRRCLAALGYTMQKRGSPLVDGSGPPGESAAVFMENAEGLKHWLAWDGRRFLDPLRGDLGDKLTEATYRFYRVTTKNGCF